MEIGRLGVWYAADKLTPAQWAALQRNLKALGTFGSQIAIHGNTRYRDAIPRTAPITPRSTS